MSAAGEAALRSRRSQVELPLTITAAATEAARAAQDGRGTGARCIPTASFDAGAQARRLGLAGQGFAQPPLQRPDTVPLAGERRIRGDAAFHVQRVFRIHLAVEIGVQQQRIVRSVPIDGRDHGAVSPIAAISRRVPGPGAT